MPIDRRSRYARCFALQDEDDRTYLSRAIPIAFVEMAGNRQHPVKRGDTLEGIAAVYFADLADPRDVVFSPAQLWWVIGEFQPEPVHDPTLVLVEGSVLHIPPSRWVRETVFGGSR